MSGHDAPWKRKSRFRSEDASSAPRTAAPPPSEDLDEVVTGRGEHAVWALHLRVLRELAHHCGHADVLREQVLARRPT